MSGSGEYQPGSIASLLGHVRSKGVRLWAENGELRYRAPRGSLSRADLEALARSKNEIIPVLERAALAESPKPRIEPRLRADRAPLTYSQLTHWRQYELWRQPSHRQIATAIRIQGRLDHAALRRSVTAIVLNQEGLRTQIVVENGQPVQSISVAAAGSLELEDLRALPEERQAAEVVRRIEDCILEPVDLATDPLFGVRLLQLDDDEHVLVLTLEHMISDMYSLNILRRDLFSAYEQAASGRPITLPRIAVLFADYATWQKENEPVWRQAHEGYWNDRLSGVAPMRFPEDVDHASRADSKGWDTVTFCIDGNQRAQLRDWCQKHGTTLVMAVFTAYVALLFRWCGQSEGIVRYQTDGRNDPMWENTIGYFALPLFLRVELREADSFLDLIKRVIGEYCNAYQHADYCYLEAQVPRPDFARSSAFNWWPSQLSAESQNEAPQSALRCSNVPFTHPLLSTLEWDAEPAIVLAESGEDIGGTLHFPKRRFSRAGMERFAGNFLRVIAALLRQPEGRIGAVELI